MSNRAIPFKKIITDLAPPELFDVLEDVPGGDPNLLPKDGWLKPLQVKFPIWTDYAHIPNTKDTMQLILNGDEENPVDSNEFKGEDSPFDPALLFLEVPVNKLVEGDHFLIYRLIPWNDNTKYRECLPVRFTVDRTAPILATDSKLIFPDAVLPPNQITAAYLADSANQDQVLATVPGYQEIKVGDVIQYYWERSPGGRELAGTKVIEQDDLGKPVQVAFKGDLLRQSTNNVDYFATYRVKDRAGNESVLSLDEKLIVNIRPPTPRKFPTVKQATGTPGADNGMLNPFHGTSGLTVVVAAAEIDPGEEVTVDFIGLGGEDGPGSIVGVGPITPGGLEFAIPKNVVAANIPVGAVSKVEVRYWAGRDAQHSAIYTLTINPFSSDSFGSVGCDKVQLGSPPTLSKATVARDGANVQIDEWVYHEDTQPIEVWAEAGSERTDILTGQPTPISDGKFKTPLPKEYVASLPLDSTFILHARVSLNQGQSFQPFTRLRIKVIE